MSFIKSTVDTVDVVCTCGMSNQRSYSEAMVTLVAVQFPVCLHCGGNVATGMFVPAYSEEFTELADDQLKRLVIAQAVHKRALNDSQSSVTAGKSKEELLIRAIRTGQHYFATDDSRTYEAPLPQGMQHARDYAIEHGKPFIATQVALENSDPELLARVDALLGGSIPEDNPQG